MRRARISGKLRRSPMRFYETIHGVYFDDLDALQILHNARYLLLFERTVGSFWNRTLGWGSPLDKDGSPDRFHLVRTNEIEYLHPVTNVGEVRVRIWVEKIGRTSLTFAFRILPMDQDIDHARGRRVLVRIDPATRKPTPWTDHLRERVAPFLHPSDAPPSSPGP